ncbi:SubName: Full=Related to RNA polymerase II mediator complex protein pmc1 {ECO:0000313/EMBL:CCA73688.1} [Serendipita indica DSM 11827]|uniref:Mediator of RNA polymerase II transcription subunit 14 n=1 Tax=Serendipita indica (strain DSM 11827) TaxID=1109443 RepID=G4TQU5_SERID|nr:SubName: Full=Related to RNA polymerase II mediator complex protein pmc1 {ECO:0000313/EMBL:CCA73688.1} [Serendipita indica DSM 11827]CCA73688.1 related to RNA polymerase II mediator complex protein pmc1 [Serendipita indica DSM 11827]
MDVQTAPIDIKPTIHSLNGFKDAPLTVPNGQPRLTDGLPPNGIAHEMGNDVKHLQDDAEWPSLQDLEKELPQIYDGQVSVAHVMHQLVHDLYSQLTNIAETLGRASDTVKKARLQQWLSLAHKQASKVYVLAKWSRNAEDIQKAMNIAAFLRTQGEQIIWATKALHSVQDEAHRLRVRNPDLLTALDVLTTGTYTRLASIHQETFVKKKPLSNKEVAQVFSQVEDVMRMRLLCRDVIPVEMRRWRIEDGRTFFTVPQQFEASMIMTGAQKDDVWAFVHVEFLFGVPEGERKGSREFPRRPPKVFTDDLSFQIRDIIMSPPLPVLNYPIPDAPLASAVVDAPLVRVYNFLQLLSLTYQLEILIYQATQLLDCGWKETLKVRVSANRRSLTVQYWVREPPQVSRNPQIPMPKPVPLSGGEVTISIVSSTDPIDPQPQGPFPPFGYPTAMTSATSSSAQATRKRSNFRTPVDQFKAEMENRLKLKGAKASDEVEHYKFEVRWKPQQGALGVVINLLALDHEGLEIDSNCLDFEDLLRKILRRHANAIMARHVETVEGIITSEGLRLFPHPGDVVFMQRGEDMVLRVQLAGDQHMMVAMDIQHGRYVIYESGDLGAVVRGGRWRICQLRVNLDPACVLEMCSRIRGTAVIEMLETRANLLGLTTFRHRYLISTSLAQLGQNTGILFIQLAKFPQHYAVILLAEVGLRFALIEVHEMMSEYGTGTGEYSITDIAWVQAERFLGLVTPDNQPVLRAQPSHDGTADVLMGDKQKEDLDVGIRPTGPIQYDPLDMSIQQIRDLHAYCRARVAHLLIESQLKARNIPCVQVHPCRSNHSRPLQATSSTNQRGGVEKRAPLRSPLEPHLPILSVRATDMLAGASAAEAAMPNIRIEPTEWWSLDNECMVHTSVQLKYVQPLEGAKGNASTNDGKLIRPSENISYDTKTSVITFLSKRVGDCVDEFLKEWARVSKVVIIARQISLMPDRKGWKDVRILSFDLQTVEFAYYQDYSLSITSVEGLYRLSFSRVPSAVIQSLSRTNTIDAMDISQEDTERPIVRNAHEDSSRFAQDLLKDDRLGSSVFELVGFLRLTIGIVEMLDTLVFENGETTSAPSTTPTKRVNPRFDIVVKAAGWWRLRYSQGKLFGPPEESKVYAMDVRLVNGRILIVDGSVDLRNGKLGSTAPSSEATSAAPARERHGLSALLPVPKMEEHVTAVLNDVKALGVPSDGVLPVSYGHAIICGCIGAPELIKRLHEKLLSSL